MGLIELCLLSLITAQEPITNGTAATAESRPHTAKVITGQGQIPEPPRIAPSTTPPERIPNDEADGRSHPIANTQDPRKALWEQEKAGAAADASALSELAMGRQPDVAARAAWLLGNNKTPAHQEQLPLIATSSPHPEARLHALQAIRISADETSTRLAIASLQDNDSRVRTVAVQLLAKLRRPASIEPLLELLNTPHTRDNDSSATDVQAALLTLADLNASQHLLRISSAIDESDAPGIGEALTYAFQILSPKLDGPDETTALVAVLGHSEALLRRYAITRLTELESTTALAALEGRLANESDELRPLIEVAIAQIQHDGRAPPTNNAELATANAKALWARAVTWWNGLTPTRQSLAGSTPIALIALMWMVRRTVKRRKHAQEVLNATALMQPSDEYLEEQEDDHGEYEYDDDYQESEDEYDEVTDDQPAGATADWGYGHQETVPANETVEDEHYR